MRRLFDHIRQEISMPIRIASLEDLQGVEACAVAAYQVYVKRMGKKPAPMVANFGQQIRDETLSVFVDETNAVLGFIVFFPKEQRMFLENVAVHPNYHGQKIGKSLIAHCENQAVRAGKSIVELYTNEKMSENLKLYPKLGYVEFDRRSEDGFNRVYFRKILG